MKQRRGVLTLLLGISLALCIAFVATGRGQNTGGASAAGRPGARTQTQSKLQKQRMDAEQQARPEVEQKRKEAEQQATKSVDQEAVAAIDETQKAIDAIAANKKDEALAAIERATGKINILTARNPATALIPVDAEVDVFDAAPHDNKAVVKLANDATLAVESKDYPDARVLLHALRSEILVRTYNLPLATYPAALQNAARLLDQNKNQEASAVLLDALNTLVVVDHVTPIPLVIAQAAVSGAESQRQKDKNAAQKLVQVAKNELERARQLGYVTSKDPQYASLNSTIANLEKQLSGNGDSTPVFAKLKEELASLLKRESDRGRH
jgi:hypothetical protein